LIELRRGKVLILDTEGLRDQSQATRQVAG
jgi:hypothetical protein